MTRRLHAAHLSVRREPLSLPDLRKGDNSVLLSCFPNVACSNPMAVPSLVCLAIINYWLGLWYLRIVGGTILEHQWSILSIVESQNVLKSTSVLSVELIITVTLHTVAHTENTTWGGSKKKPWCSHGIKHDPAFISRSFPSNPSIISHTASHKH